MPSTFETVVAVGRQHRWPHTVIAAAAAIALAVDGRGPTESVTDALNRYNEAVGRERLGNAQLTTLALALEEREHPTASHSRYEVGVDETHEVIFHHDHPATGLVIQTYWHTDEDDSTGESYLVVEIDATTPDAGDVPFLVRHEDGLAYSWNGEENSTVRTVATGARVDRLEREIADLREQLGTVAGALRAVGYKV